MGCDCNTPEGIKARKKRKMEIKKGIERTRINFKYRCCKHCEHMSNNKCGLSKNKKTTLDDILKNDKYKCPLGYFK